MTQAVDERLAAFDERLLLIEQHLGIGKVEPDAPAPVTFGGACELLGKPVVIERVGGGDPVEGILTGVAVDPTAATERVFIRGVGFNLEEIEAIHPLDASAQADGLWGSSASSCSDTGRSSMYGTVSEKPEMLFKVEPQDAVRALYGYVSYRRRGECTEHATTRIFGVHVYKDGAARFQSMQGGVTIDGGIESYSITEG